jgi:hypothetical protein
MTEAVAATIADLINRQNQLNVRYTPERILAEKDSYIVRTRQRRDRRCRSKESAVVPVRNSTPLG